MPRENTNLVWIDIETTGLQPDNDEILEVCCVVTSKDLDIIAVSDSFVIHNNYEVIMKMDDWCKNTHKNNGLIQEVLISNLGKEEVESNILEFLNLWIDFKSSPMCGSSVHFDRSFLKNYMPKLENYFTHRNLDVSSMKEVVYKWYDFEYIKDEVEHRAKPDIIQSIQELEFYKKNFFI